MKILRDYQKREEKYYLSKKSEFMESSIKNSYNEF
jgi:hypothetical protein